MEVSGVLAESTVLRFPPPYVELAVNRSAVEYNWRILQGLFDLSDPDAIPPLGVGPSAKEQVTLARFCRNARKLMGFSLVNEGASFTYDFDAGSVTCVVPSHEAMAGWAAQFRLLYGNEEPAGYAKCRSILIQLCSTQTDSDRERRIELLRPWYKGESTLRSKTVTELSIDAYARMIGGSGGPPNLRFVSPEANISEYLYGEYLHTDEDKADRIAKRDEVADSTLRSQFLQSTLLLSYIYVGFSLLIEKLGIDS